jgi:uncharacterized membrane protein
MLALIAIGIGLSILLVNLAGLSLAAMRLTRDYALARAASPVLLVVPLFFLEHFAGLGWLAWVWPVTTAASLWLVWKHVREIEAHWKTEVLFLGGFFYAFAWRFCFPDLNASSEKLTDLGFIGNYLAGTRLPPVDRWFPPFAFDVYYGLQYYGAALMGRIFGMDGGYTYNLSFCVLVGMTVVAAGGAARLLCGRRRWWLLPLAAFLLGGTGASPLMPLIHRRPALHESMRFIGGSAVPGTVDTAFGKWLVSASGVPAKDAPELPAETFSYLVYLGDLHPPVSGFFLLALALLCLVLAEQNGESGFAQALLVATVPLTLAVDAWNLPLQAALVAVWMVYRVRGRNAPHWRACAAGLFLPAVLLWPFLESFGWRSLDYHTAWRLVLPGEHTPPLLGLTVLYPLAGVLVATLLARDRPRLSLWLAALCLVLLAASEAFFIDDTYSGKFNRFNTTLKWWPWIYSAGLLALGSLNLASKSRACRVVTSLALAMPALFSADLAAQFLLAPKPHIGRLAGDAWIASDPAEKAILEYLRRQPPSIVLQRPAVDAFTDSPALTMFAGQTAFLGWPAHEKLWRGARLDIDLRADQVGRFYRGELEDAAEWLVENRIDYVLWLNSEADRPPGSFEKIQTRIAEAYYWREYSHAGGARVGFWSRRAP